MKNYSYKEILENNLEVCRAKLKSIEEREGMYSERWHIANQNILDQEYFLKHGIPRNPIQSVALPHEILEQL